VTKPDENITNETSTWPKRANNKRAI